MKTVRKQIGASLMIAVAMTFAATSTAKADLNDVLLDAFAFPRVPIIFEDDNATFVGRLNETTGKYERVNDGTLIDGDLVLGVFHITAITQGNGFVPPNSIKDVGTGAGGSTTLPEPAGFSIEGLTMAVVSGTPGPQPVAHASDFAGNLSLALAPISGPVTILDPGGGADIIVSDFVTPGAMISLYLDESFPASPSPVINRSDLSVALDGVSADSVLNGEKLVEFGFDAFDGDTFYFLNFADDELVEFVLSMDVLAQFNSGLPQPITKNDLGSHLYGVGDPFVSAVLSGPTLFDPPEFNTLGDGDFKILIPTPAALPAGLALLGFGLLRRRR